MDTLDRLNGTPLKEGMAVEVHADVNDFLRGTRSVDELEALWRAYPC